MKALLATLCLGFSILAGTFLLPTTNAYGQSNSELSGLLDSTLCNKATQTWGLNIDFWEGARVARRAVSWDAHPNQEREYGLRSPA